LYKNRENLEEKVLTMGYDGVRYYDPDATGEATSLYLWDKLKDCNVRVSRLGLGLPMGADVKYADALTLSNALKGRRSL